MKTSNREFIAERMPHGWVICERHIDGALSIIDNNCSNKREANLKLKQLYAEVLQGTVAADSVSAVH